MPNKQRKILITGASSGLGSALANHYAKENAVLGLVGRNLNRLNYIANTTGVECLTFCADVRNPISMRGVAFDFIDRYGVPDLVIANAGISCGTSSEFEEDNDVFTSIMETNLMGTVHTFQPFIRRMKVRGSGCLASISSVAAFRGIPGAAAYSASKGAINLYSEALRTELYKTGVKSISICPGYIATPLTTENEFPMPWIMEPMEAAEKVAWHIDHSYGCVVTPWQMNLLSKILKHIPYKLYDPLFHGIPPKKRQTHQPALEK